LNVLLFDCLGDVAMIKHTLLALAIGGLVGAVSPQVTAATEMTPAQIQEYREVTNAGRIQALEKVAGDAREAGDEKRAAAFEKAAESARGNPTGQSAAQTEPKTPAEKAEEAALKAEITSVSIRGASDALQEKANTDPAFKEVAERFSKGTESFDKATVAAQTDAVKAAEKDLEEAKADAKEKAEAAGDVTAEEKAEPAAESSGSE
jgi:hypothetical protein